eukprot:2068802-Rhodomonas_salina.1
MCLILENSLRAHGAEEEWHFHIWKHSVFGNGIQSTAALIRAEEFDRCRAQRPDALCLFTED